MSETTILPIAFLVFGAVIIGMEIFVLAKKNQGFGPQAVRIIGITVVLVIAAALSSINLSLDRLTPIIGLLGTLAGYLAGRGETKSQQ